MRTISLVKRLKWSFSGNMNPHALVVGDVDNDGDIEFVIGNLNGDLAIFKGECEAGAPTFLCRNLGTITCIAVGDARNCGKNSVVCINAEGLAHIFDIPRLVPGMTLNLPQISAEEYLTQTRHASDTATIQAFRNMMAVDNEIPSNNVAKSAIYDLQQPNLTLKVPVNVNRILIADIDGDGFNELVLARTDRILHAFQLSPPESDYAVLRAMDTVSLTSTSTSASSSTVAHRQPHAAPSIFSGGKEKGKLLVAKNPLNDAKERRSSFLERSMNWSRSLHKDSSRDNEKPPLTAADDNVQLLEKDMWVFDGQITSLSVTRHPERPEEPILLVAQPGNTFTIIDKDGNRYSRDFTPQYSARTHYGKHHKKFNQSASGAQGKKTSEPEDEKEGSRNESSEEVELGTTPKASDGPLFGARKTSQFELQKGNERGLPVPSPLEPEKIIVACHGKNWSNLDGDDIVGDEDNGSMATEIVIARSTTPASENIDATTTDDDLTNVGMLTMDGKFSVYNLRTQEMSQYDLFVTHKLFSLATLDISHVPPRPGESFAVPRSLRELSMRHSPAGSPQLRFPSPLTKGESYYSNNGDKQENPSNAASPSFSSSSRLSRVARNTSEMSSAAATHTDEDKTGRSESSESVLSKALMEAAAESISEASVEDSSDGEDTSSSSSLDESWSDNENEGNLSEKELFVACAWNGVTYLIDWSQRTPQDNGYKFQLVKFAFERRVCAFTAGLYAVAPGYNLPCLFYVDFEDNIHVYYDVRVAPGPVSGFLERIDDDIEEALERIIDLESSIKELNSSARPAEGTGLDPDDGAVIDLGDGWKGIVDGDVMFNTGEDILDTINTNELDLAGFIHECLYGFEDMKDRLESQVLSLEKKHLIRHLSVNMDIRRLSDLNIRIEPPLERDTESEGGGDSESISRRSTMRSLSQRSFFFGENEEWMQSGNDGLHRRHSVSGDEGGPRSV